QDLPPFPTRRSSDLDTRSATASPRKRDSQPKGGWQTLMKWIVRYLAVRCSAWLGSVVGIRPDDRRLPSRNLQYKILRDILTRIFSLGNNLDLIRVEPSEGTHALEREMPYACLGGRREIVCGVHLWRKRNLGNLPVLYPK